MTGKGVTGSVAARGGGGGKGGSKEVLSLVCASTGRLSPC